MFLDLLDRLREKPRPYRLRVSIISAAVITAMIALTYLSAVVARTQDSPPIRRTEVTTAPSPFASFREGFADIFGSGRERLERLYEDVFPTTEYQQRGLDDLSN